jgi:hypothetical protein
LTSSKIHSRSKRYEHYEKLLDDMVGDKKELKKTLEENPFPAPKEFVFQVNDQT